MQRVEIRWHTPFGRFMRTRGVPNVVQDLRGLGVPISDRAPYKWLSGRRAPRLEAAVALVQISGGRLSFNDIFRHCQQMAAGPDVEQQPPAQALGGKPLT